MSDSKSAPLNFRITKVLPYDQALQLARDYVASPSVRFARRKTVALIDLYGIYRGVTQWMGKHDVPPTTAELPARIAGHLLWSAMRQVREREQQELPFSGRDFDSLVGNFMITMEGQDAPNPDCVTELDMRWELFYAPSPLKQVERALIARRRHIPDIDRKLERLQTGVIDTQHEQRDYRIYDDFIHELTTWLGARNEQPGFYNIIVKPQVVCLDEKEVDIRLAIRAMDIMAGNEADAICIVSSDQDYMPLHERVRDAGLNTYHADVAKFDNPRNIGRRIQGMDEQAIQARMTKEITGVLIQEYVGSPQMLHLTSEQYSALWRIHHELGGRF
ncbi:NYN domain-containing protein [Paracoccus actinidiae]|uniref:NYN domain-containing protein n=1 Tax=Paracoccus actinidiae TaxID=3064531 RepID=UPI0027D242C9|nr:NYN domain-containing protein [Paracoccus sp. M09]